MPAGSQSSASASSSANPMRALKELEAKFNEGMTAFEKRCTTLAPDITSPSGDLNMITLLEEFRSFKEVMLQALGLLRTQLSSLTQLVDNLDNQGRRKFLLFRGVPENAGESPAKAIEEIVVSKLKIVSFSTESDVTSCYRLGKQQGDKKRPILVRFANTGIRSQIWQSKKELKGSDISVAEFLTPLRRQIFNEARARCGVHNSWTNDGNVYIKLKGGDTRRLFNLLELDELLPKQETSTLSAQPTKPAKQLRTRSGNKAHK